MIARWTSVDPLVEEDQESTTPYGYVFNNPVKLTDPDGREPCCELELGVLAAGFQAAGDVEVGSFGTGTHVAALIVVGTVASAGLLYIGDHLPHLSGSFPSSSGDHPVMSRDNTRVNSYLPRSSPAILEGRKSAEPGSRPGKVFTPKGKQTVIDENKAKNNGKATCVDCGVETTKPEQSKRGVTPPSTDTNVDHKKAKSKGGSGTPENGEVRCRGCNIKKSDKDITPTPPAQ